MPPLLAKIPAAVQQIIAAEADCAALLFHDAVSSDSHTIAVQDLRDAADTTTTTASEAAALTLLYDVMKVERQRVMLEAPHLNRIRQSYLTMTHQKLPEERVQRIQRELHHYVTAASAADAAPQNVKWLSWLPAVSDTGAVRAPDPFVIFFTKSFFPPAEWYETGTTMALLYDAYRENPSAKVVQSALRGRAKDMQGRAGVFEVLLVHGPGDRYLIPEGSRSNYLIVTDANEVACSLEKDILVGITLSAARQASERVGLGSVQHRALTLRDLCAAKSLVMLGTSPGTLPVREVVLYLDEHGKARFEAAAKELGIATESLKNLVTTASSPPRAVLQFEAHNSVVDKLMAAYHEVSLSG